MKKPTKYTETKGKAIDENKLNSLDKALLSANIGNYNLISVSSILPKECKYKKNLLKNPPGTILPTIISTKTSNQKGKRISSAISIAEGKNLKVVAESTGNQEKEKTEQSARKKAKKMLKNRNQETKSIKSFSTEKEVEKTTTVLTAIVLGD